jgi:predicted AlkP superfamily pyrophosphatase or phosphodiesterase
MRHLPAAGLLVLSACATSAPGPAPAATLPVQQAEVRPLAEQPTLVLLITVDQLRPEYPEMFASHMSGGLARLYKSGALFTNAFQDHGNTETAPGHASTLSGRFPRSTGIVANIAGVNDENSPLVGARGEGASPFRFRGTVLADWMRAKDPATRLLSVSRKDRGAILPLGRIKDEVFWYASNGTFTTSVWYADTLPTWVQAFNSRRLPQQYAGQSWDLLLDAGVYTEPDSVPVEGGGRNFLFPHPMSEDTARAAALLPNYPMMDEVTLQFALAGLLARGLGDTPGRTDLLAVSLSSTDAVGHAYGPDSRELHDQILRLDKSLGTFLDSLYKVRDSSRILIGLTSDHGVAPYAQAEVKSRFRSAPGGFADLRPVLAAVYRGMIAAGVDSSAFRWEGESLYLEPEPFRRARVNRDSVSRVLALNLARVEGVLRSETYTDLMKRNPARDPIARRWQQMYAPDMPIAVVTTLRPFWYFAGTINATHGSPHDYDAHVPVLFAGPGIKPGRYDELARVVDMAPTFAALLGVRPLERLDGVVLTNALR